MRHIITEKVNAEQVLQSICDRYIADYDMRFQISRTSANIFYSPVL